MRKNYTHKKEGMQPFLKDFSGSSSGTRGHRMHVFLGMDTTPISLLLTQRKFHVSIVKSTHQLLLLEKW